MVHDCTLVSLALVLVIVGLKNPLLMDGCDGAGARYEAEMYRQFGGQGASRHPQQ